MCMAEVPAGNHRMQKASPCPCRAKDGCSTLRRCIRINGIRRRLTRRRCSGSSATARCVPTKGLIRSNVTGMWNILWRSGRTCYCLNVCRTCLPMRCFWSRMLMMVDDRKQCRKWRKQASMVMQVPMWRKQASMVM